MKIVVGVSGGVDSAFAAMSLKDAGNDVIGVHLKIKFKEDNRDTARLEALQAITKIQVIQVKCRDVFEKRVISAFLDAYRCGKTPNPCVICNETFKLRTLMEIADSLGADKVASGHYAKISTYKGVPAIERTDTIKDQTYALYRLPPEWISRLCFPLADIKKPDVKEEIAQAFHAEGLANGESQDICFLEGRSLKGYLREKLMPSELFPGEFVDESGRSLSRHKGLIFYTEGQRKGLGLSCGPWYVKERDFKTGKLYLSHGIEPKTSIVHFEGASWQQEVTPKHEYDVKVCYRFPPVRAILTEFNGTSGTVQLIAPSIGVSVGQSLVFYDGKTLMGGGFITESE